MLIHYTLIVIALCLSCVTCPQPWHSVGNDSFISLDVAEDGGLLLIRSPGDILRSTDTGGTWEVVYTGSTALTAFGSLKEAPTEMFAFSDTIAKLVSRDSGRTWGAVDDERGAAPPPSPHLFSEEGELPAGTNSVTFADSAWWAVGEPGLICRWDGTEWRELHRAPFAESSEARITTPLNPFLFLDEPETKIAFSSSSHGAISVGNRIYFTNDSAVTWTQTVLPDTSPITSSFLLTDSTTLLGMRDGRLYYDSSDILTRVDSILNGGQIWGIQSVRNDRPILEIGWKDRLDGNLFVLTDSLLYSLRSDLSSAAAYSLPLLPGQRACVASFPDDYTGFLLADSTRYFDTLAADGRDTTLCFDTCQIYRSLDGGATWTVVLKNIPGLTTMYFVNTQRGFACGAKGLILHTEDSGSRWARAWTMTRQNLHDLRFADDSVGYAAGDSGVVLMTRTRGRFWRLLPPEPLFTRPATAYTGIGFPNAGQVFVVARDRGYQAKVVSPMYWRSHWRWPERHTLSISERPNPATGAIQFDIQKTSGQSISEFPEIYICTLSGTRIATVSTLLQITPGEWSGSTDVSSLTPGPYMAVVTLGGEQSLCKFVVEH